MNKDKEGWVAKLVEVLVAKLVRRMGAMLVAHLLITASSLGSNPFETRHPSKIIIGRHKQRSGQHTLVSQKLKINKKIKKQPR